MTLISKCLSATIVVLRVLEALDHWGSVQVLLSLCWVHDSHSCCLMFCFVLFCFVLLCLSVKWKVTKQKKQRKKERKTYKGDSLPTAMKILCQWCSTTPPSLHDSSIDLSTRFCLPLESAAADDYYSILLLMLKVWCFN